MCCHHMELLRSHDEIDLGVVSIFVEIRPPQGDCYSPAIGRELEISDAYDFGAVIPGLKRPQFARVCS